MTSRALQSVREGCKLHSRFRFSALEAPWLESRSNRLPSGCPDELRRRAYSDDQPVAQQIGDIQASLKLNGLEAQRTNGTVNRLSIEDRPIHDWYRFVLSFPPHLVRDYLGQFQVSPGHTVLDPFCGTGTVLVECKKRGIDSVGIEAHPLTHMVASVKTNWEPRPDELLADAENVAQLAARLISDSRSSPRTLQGEAAKLLIGGSISPIPLHKALVLRDTILTAGEDGLRDHQLLALAASLPSDIGNLHFGQEVGVRSPKDDAPVIASWLERVHHIAADLDALAGVSDAVASVLRADSRASDEVLERGQIDAVITSPPYPNEKDYTRTTRLESVILGFVTNRAELRATKRDLVRSNTRGVYKSDDDDEFLDTLPEAREIADEIEERRLRLGKTSGFEKQYPRVTRLYFGGMVKHLSGLREVLTPGAKLAYVVGDQASYLRVMIRTGELLALAAERLGYEVLRRDLFRTRHATATGAQLREEVLVLRWPG